MVGTQTWRLADLGSKHMLLKEGIGWGYMPEPIVREDVEGGRLVPLPVTVAIPVTLKLQARRPSLRPVGRKFLLAARLHQAQGISDDNEPRVIIWLRQPELRGAFTDRPPPPGVGTRIS